MNRFAHSVDTPVTSIDLMEDPGSGAQSFRLPCFRRKNAPQSYDGDRPIALTSPFILQAIIYRAVVQAFKSAGPTQTCMFQSNPGDESTWRILFDGFTIKDGEVFPDDRIVRMAESIGVSIHWDRGSDCLEVDVPVSIGSAEGLGQS